MVRAFWNRLVVYFNRLDYIWQSADFWTKLGIVVFVPLTFILGSAAILIAISLVLFGPDIARVMLGIVFLWAAAMFFILKFIPMWMRAKEKVG